MLLFDFFVSAINLSTASSACAALICNHIVAYNFNTCSLSCVLQSRLLSSCCGRNGRIEGAKFGVVVDVVDAG
jgi:hypothetical protein